MIDAQQQDEKASGLILAGWMACLFDALVLFFLPSAVRQGRQFVFLMVMGALLAAGLVLVLSGHVIRKRMVSNR